MWRRDGPLELGIPPTEFVRPCLWRTPDLVDQQHSAKAGPGKTTERRRVQAVTGADLGEEDLMQHSAAVCSSHPSESKETTLVGAKVVLTVLERDQQVLKQDPDTWRLERVRGRLDTEIGDLRGQLLQGSKAVLKQFQVDAGSGEWGHRSDATA